MVAHCTPKRDIVYLSSAMTTLNSSLPTGLLLAIFWIGAAGCVVAQFFILRAVWRVAPIILDSHTVPAPRRVMEVAWAILPAFLLLGAFVGAWQLMHPSESTPTTPTTTASAEFVPVVRS